MIRKRLRCLISACLVMAMTLGLTACGDTVPGDGAQAAEKSNAGNDNGNSGTGKDGEVVTVSLYPYNANLNAGVVSGYLGDFFADKGLAVEVWSYSEEKTNAILASGELPDIMYVTADQLKEMIDSDMVLQLDDYLDKIPNIASRDEALEPAFNYIREYRSNGTGNVYAFPTDVGAIAVSDDSTDRNSIKVYWEAYELIGAPEIKNFDDYIDVAKQMMEAYPVDKNGNATYGMFLNSGSDDSYWGNILLWMRWNGYTETHLPYLLEADMINEKVSSILEDDSMYYQGLKFYNKAMRAGVIDPDSINMDRTTVGARTRMVSSGTSPGWRDGYYEYLMPGTKVYWNQETAYGDVTYGNTNQYIVINKDTKNLDACLKLMDVFSDVDNMFIKAGAGPEGDFYTITDDGHIYMTEKAKEYHKNSSGDPYITESGEELYQWNTSWILGGETSYLGYDDVPVNIMHAVWNEELEITSNTENYNAWKEVTGYESWKDCLEKNDALVSGSDLDYIQAFLTTPDDNLQLTVSAINSIVVTASWNMVYAKSDEEFESIWRQMVSDCIDLGAQDVIDWRLEDIENAKAIRDSMN